MELFKRVWKDIQRGENIDLYATILLAFVIVIVSLLGVVASELVTSLTLAILGLLAISNLVSRYHLEEFSKKFEIPNTPLLRSRKDLAKFPETARDAKDILIIAFSASAVLLDTQFFVNKIDQGTRVRLAVINPDQETVVEILGRIDLLPAEGVRAHLTTSARLVEIIRKKVSNTALFEVRFFNYLPTLSFVMIDSNLPTGRIVVGMYPFQVDPPQRPYLLVTAKDHPEWYIYFRNIAEAIWQDAKISSN